MHTRTNLQDSEDEFQWRPIGQAMADHRRVEIRHYDVIYNVFDDLKKALSEAGILPPDEVIGLLTTRLETLDKENAAQQDDLKVWVERLPRILRAAAWTTKLGQD